MTKQTDLITHRGGCHCGKVKFEVDAPTELEVQLCNCSICSMTAYTFNTEIAQHRFCTHCGIKSFYIPRSNPDGVSVNVRCLEPETIAKIRITDFDGRNWEKHADDLKHFSEEGV